MLMLPDLEIPLYNFQVLLPAVVEKPMDDSATVFERVGPINDSALYSRELAKSGDPVYWGIFQ